MASVTLPSQVWRCRLKCDASVASVTLRSQVWRFRRKSDVVVTSMTMSSNVWRCRRKCDVVVASVTLPSQVWRRCSPKRLVFAKLSRCTLRQFFRPKRPCLFTIVRISLLMQKLCSRRVHPTEKITVRFFMFRFSSLITFAMKKIALAMNTLREGTRLDLWN
jgi:hypothetical protein